MPAKARTPLRSIPDLEVENLLAGLTAATTVNGTAIFSLRVEGSVKDRSVDDFNDFAAETAPAEVAAVVAAVPMPASNRLHFRINKFTDHDDFSKEFVSVNNIWLEANQCLTARVIAMRTDFYL